MGRVMKSVAFINPIFTQTYQHYLNQLSSMVFDSAISERLGITVISENNLRIKLFNECYDVSSQGIMDQNGKDVTFEKCVVLSRYVIHCQNEPVVQKDDWFSFKDFKDAGPLKVYFLNAVELPISNHFSGSVNALKDRINAIGGIHPEIDLPYHLCLIVQALPKIPLLVLFNDQDEEFPATCKILFKKSADTYLDAESLAILAAIFSNMVCHNKLDHLKV